MATQRNVPTVRQMLEPAFREMPFAGNNTINERIAEAQRRGDKKEVERLNLLAGVESAATGIVTGLPDLAVMGYNWSTTSNVKDLRTRILEANGTPTQATDQENSLSYNLPEYALMAQGLFSLIKGGVKSIAQVRSNKKMLEFTRELEASAGAQTANTFKKFLATGQGSDNPMVYAALNQLKSNPKYAELFSKLDKAATDVALKAMVPRPSSQTAEEATKGIVRTVQDKLDSVVKARNTAGDAAFNKAFALAQDRPLVTPSNTVNALSDLRVQFLKSRTPEAQKTVEVIDKLQESILKNGQIQPLTVPEFQQLLHEFGKKVGSEDAIVQGLSQTNLERINKTIFGNLKSDLASSLKTASTTTDKQALGALESARVQYKKASDSYNSLIAQGIPKFLQNKSLDEVSFEDLSKAYTGLNQGQRTLFRSWVGGTRAESLQALDSKVFKDFLGKSYGTLEDGTQGYDLGKLAKSWQDLKVKDPNQADMLVQALGTNANEFNQRMKDALVFTRKMSVQQPVKEAGVVERVGPDAGRLAGMGSYAAKQGVDLAVDVYKKFTKGLTDDMLAKILLSPESRDFLKNASLSPTSIKTLEALDKLDKAVLPATKVYTSLGQAFTGINAMYRTPATESIGAPDDLFIPDDVLQELQVPQAGQPADDLFIPDDVLQELQSQSLGMNTTAPESALRAQVNLGANGTVNPGNLGQLNPDVLMQDPQVMANPEAQSVLRQLGLLQ